MSAIRRLSTAVTLALLCVLAAALGNTGCGGSGSSTAGSPSGPFTLSPATGTVIPAVAGPLAPGALAFSQTFTVVGGGAPPYTFVATTTPPGLTLAASSVQSGLVGTLSAILSGTPSTPGLEQFSMTITDANRQQFFATYFIEVGQATPLLKITPTTLPNGIRGTPYTQFLTASNGVEPFTWSVTTGPLPPGMSFLPSTTTTYELTGTPSTAGTFSFTVQAVDGSTPQRSLSLNLSLTVP